MKFWGQVLKQSPELQAPLLLLHEIRLQIQALLLTAPALTVYLRQLHLEG